MPEILDWRHEGNAETIRRAVRVLAEGGLAAFPLETTYSVAASALAPDAVARLGSPGPITVAVRDADEALEWDPAMSPLARRFARRCWPGPVELIGSQPNGTSRVFAGLPEFVRQRLGEGGLRLRTPNHPAILQVMEQMGGPIVFRSCGSPGSEATTPQEVLRIEGDGLALMLDDGPTRYGRPATSVRVDGNTWEIVGEGIVPRDLLARLSCCAIVFVCTGNTCRSPMAEALCQKLLAERLGCAPAELPERGYLVQSAGLSASMGSQAAEEAVAIVREFGADLGQHSSQPVTADLVEQADHLLVMTQGHLRLLTAYFPHGEARPRLLHADGLDIGDPLGGSSEIYRDCAREIQQQLERFLAEVHPS